MSWTDGAPQGDGEGSMDNVITVLRRNLGLCPHKYDLHVNFPGGVPIDGPSAGIAIVTALYSAITDLPVDNLVAMTGEISIRGFVRPVGGIVAKLEAARLAGVRRAIIPKENWQDTFAQLGTMEVVPVERIEEVIEHAVSQAGLSWLFTQGFDHPWLELGTVLLAPRHKEITSFLRIPGVPLPLTQSGRISLAVTFWDPVLLSRGSGLAGGRRLAGCPELYTDYQNPDRRCPGSCFGVMVYGCSHD